MIIEELKIILEQHSLWLNDPNEGQHADLTEANLRGADLSDADLRDADLRGADLRGADLRGADLSDADLTEADLTEANLRGADLSDADLSDADLRGADLRGADLRGANLNDANLTCTKLKLFQSDQWTAYIQPNCIVIGCQKHPTEAWKNFTDEEIEKMHPDALSWWEKHKAIIFAIQESL